jgi:hypothetical protein
MVRGRRGRARNRPLGEIAKKLAKQDRQSS